MVKRVKEKFSLESYKYSDDAKARLRQIVKKIKDNDIISAEKKIASLALDVLRELENKEMSPNKADNYFALLDIYIGDNCANINFSEEIRELLLEGMTLHDLEKSFGANTNYMKSLANKILQKT